MSAPDFGPTPEAWQAEWLKIADSHPQAREFMLTLDHGRALVEDRDRDHGAPIGICAHCHRDILDTDATDETGTLHIACAGDAAAMIADMLTDRARDEAMMRGDS